MLYCGFDVSLRKKSIVGIFDIDGGSVSSSTRDLLRDAEKNGRSTVVGSEIPKSFILTSEAFSNQMKIPEASVYFTQLSSQSLRSRAGHAWFSNDSPGENK